MKSNQSFGQLFHYQEELKQKTQQIQNLILQSRRDQQTLKNINSLIGQEQNLLKYLEVQSFQMQPQVRTLYSKNIARFKKKVKQHKQYIDTYFGKGSYQSENRNDYQKLMMYQNQNLQLQTNKMTMYQNQRLQNTMGYNVQQQGDVLNQQFQHHRQMRQQAQQAEGAITLIQKAMMKRKLMFGSLIVLFAIAVIVVIVKKVNKLASS